MRVCAALTSLVYREDQHRSTESDGDDDDCLGA